MVVPAQDADAHARLVDVDLFVRLWCVYGSGLVMLEVLDSCSLDLGFDILRSRWEA
jgi:hypothetical protein